jgi:hypothetical protein
MATIQFPPTSGGATTAASAWPKHQVQYRRKWSDAWTTLDYLQCRNFTTAASPTIPRASFLWRTGPIRREDRSAESSSVYDAVNPLDLDGAFIRVQLLPGAVSPNTPGNAGGGEPFTVWVGVVAQLHTDVFGSARPFPGTGDGSRLSNVLNSDQEFVAYGLEYLFTREPIVASWWADEQADEMEPSIEQANHVLVFNERFIAGFTQIGNRSADRFPTPDQGAVPDAQRRTSYLFGDTENAWSAYDIVEYLLAYFGPAKITITIGGQVKALQALKPPQVRVVGMNLHQALNRVIDRRRGLGWVLRAVDARVPGGSLVGGGSNNFELFVFGVFDQAVQLGDGGIEANPPQQITLSTNRTLEKLTTMEGSIGRPGKIIVEGERVVSCFTVSVQEETLAPAWSTSDEAAYKTGANLDQGPADTTHSPDAKKLNDAARAAARFENVYRAFRIPNDWNWRAGSGTGTGGNKQIASPLVNLQTAQLDPSQEFKSRGWGHRLLRTLPVKEATGAADNTPEYRAPFVIAAVSGKHVFLHHHADASRRTAHLRLLDSDFGFVVEMSPNHLIAGSNWSGAKPSVDMPEFDYHTFLATVAVRTDATLRVEVAVPEGDESQQIHIRVRDAEVWYILPNTVKDIDKDGQLVRFTEAEKLSRDDSPRLRQIAAMAAAWYGHPHASVEIKDRAMLFGYPVGTYISRATQFDSYQEINSIVSQLTIDLDEASTTLNTDFVELEFDDRAIT